MPSDEIGHSVKAHVLPHWQELRHAAGKWACPREPRDGDVPLILYRDANSWCPFCHRVWYFMEEKGLRYATQRIHLQGDSAEPPKQSWYKRLVPSGVVPALRIRDEVVPESLDILFRLEEEFPEPQMLPPEDLEYAQRLSKFSSVFDTDASDWLHNRRISREERLRNEAMAQFQELEKVLSARGGPFFLGEKISLIDAVFVGFLTRQSHNLLYFKGIDLRDPARHPCLAAWFKAMETRPAYNHTKQDAYFEQRIYQSHPERRPFSEHCMHLGPQGSLVGEPDCELQPTPPEAYFQPAEMAALEAAWNLTERRELVIAFLHRKHRKPDDCHARAATELHLRALVAVLVGVVNVVDAASILVDVAAWTNGCVSNLGALIGTPRDMSSAAAAQVRGAIKAISSAICSTVPNRCQGQLISTIDHDDFARHCKDCGGILQPSKLCPMHWLVRDATANPFDLILNPSDEWLEQALRFAEHKSQSVASSTPLIVRNEVIVIFYDGTDAHCLAVVQALHFLFEQHCALCNSGDAGAVCDFLSARNSVPRDVICRRGGISALLPSGTIIDSCERRPQILLYELRYRRSVIPPQRDLLLSSESQFWAPLRQMQQIGDTQWWRSEDALHLIRASLKRENLCILDNFLPSDQFHRLACAAVKLDQSSLLERGLVKQRRHGKLYFDVSKLRLEETGADFFHSEQVQQHWAMFKDEVTFTGDDNTWNQLTTATDLLTKCLREGNGSRSRDVAEQLQYVTFREETQVACFRKAERGRYQHHIDTDGGPWRRLTVIFYLNNDWTPEDGGELRIFMPGKHNTNVSCDVLPVANRLVLFWADDRVPHEVLSVQRDRWAATIWYSDGPTILENLAGGTTRLSKLETQVRLPISVVAIVEKFLSVGDTTFYDGLKVAGLAEPLARRIAEVSNFLDSRRHKCSSAEWRRLVQWVTSHGCIPTAKKRKRTSSDSSSTSES